MSQHALLTPERWSQFDLGQQLLQIGAEMFRATRFVQSGRVDLARFGYERVLRLVDLTVEVQSKSNLRRELLRWRDVVAELYLSDAPDFETHRLATRTFLQLHSATAEQIPLLPL